MVLCREIEDSTGPDEALLVFDVISDFCFIRADSFQRIDDKPQGINS